MKILTNSPLLKAATVATLRMVKNWTLVWDLMIEGGIEGVSYGIYESFIITVESQHKPNDVVVISKHNH